MLRVDDIKTNLLHLIGWKQSIEQNSVIAESLLRSDSGLFYQEAHPLLTLQNINALAPDFKNIVYDAWNETKPYIKGQIVSYEIITETVTETIVYRAVRQSQNVIPNTSTDDWEIFNAFSEWLEDKIAGIIMQALTDFINKKAIDSNTRGILLNKPLFDGTGRIFNTIEKTNNTVGFELVPIRSKGVTTKIEKIGLQFNAAGPVTILIMHSSSFEPFKTLTFEVTKPNSFNWFVPTEDIYLPYTAENIIGGSWYILYDEQSLPENMKAINGGVDFSNGPCSSCTRVQANNWNTRSKYIEVYPLRTPSPQTFELFDGVYMFDTNFGINLELSILCDLTDFVIEQKHLFVDLLHKKVAISLLREMAFNANMRVNRNAFGVSKADILYELDGDSTSIKKSGLGYEYTNALKTIDFNTRGINNLCLPCKQKGVRYKSI